MGLLDVFRPAPDYTTLDFDSAMARLDDIITGAFPNIQSNTNKITGWRIYQGAVCFILDILNKRINNEAKQSRITTATLLPAVLGLFRLNNYTPPGRAAASVNLTWRLRAPQARDVSIPLDKVAKTDNPNAQKFRNSEVGIIVAGQTEVTLPARNSDRQTDFFISSGKPAQRFVLTFSPFVEDSIRIGAANGSFVRAAKNNLFDALPSDLVYTLIVDDFERAIVTFGDGVNGAIPIGQIAFEYETGGGLVGNVSPGLIRNTDQDVVDSAGSPVAIDVINLTKSDGGDDRPTLATIKRLGPIASTASDVTVKRSDFVARALNVPGVKRAIAVTSNQDIGVPENATFIYVVPTGGGVASEALRNAVKAQFKEVDGFPAPPWPTHNTHLVEVFTALYVPVDWQAIVYLQAGAKPSVVRSLIQKARDDFFALTVSSSDPTIDGGPNPQVDFGGNLQDANGAVDGRLAWSKMENTVNDVTGVNRLDPSGGFLVNGVQQDVILLPAQFPVAGNLVIVNGAVGQPL